jgi:16S rRNA (guanine527-N7)-methyltransferase
VQESAHERATSESSIASAGAALGLLLPESAVSQLQRYLELLQRWNAVYNLTAIRDPAAMRVQHVFDCLAVARPMTRATADLLRPRVLDVGSGAGLPGVVLAIVDPRLQISCVDAVGKKAAFVAQVAGELGLPNLESVHARVESMSGADFDAVMSRAFSSLSDFVALTRRSLGADGVWMAMKGRTPTDEIEKLPETVEVFHVEQLSVPQLDAERCLVWMRPLH